MAYLSVLIPKPLTMAAYRREAARRSNLVVRKNCKGSESLQGGRWTTTKDMQAILRRSSKIGASLRQKFC